MFTVHSAAVQEGSEISHLNVPQDYISATTARACPPARTSGTVRGLGSQAGLHLPVHLLDLPLELPLYSAKRAEQSQ